MAAGNKAANIVLTAPQAAAANNGCRMSTRPVLLLVLLALPLEAGYLALRRLGDLQQNAVETIGLWFAISIFYLVSCWWVMKNHPDGASRPRRGMTGWLALAGLAFRLTVLPLYPSLSEDPHRYRWEGKLQQAGGNPYLAKPQDPRWSGLRDRTWASVNRKDLPTAYGPVLEWLYRGTYLAASRLASDEFRQVWLFKIPFLVFDLGAAAVILQLLRRLRLPACWAVVYFWSPLSVVEIWAVGHNDSALIFFLLAALWAGSAGRWGWAMGALWMAALCKFWPLLLFPLFCLSGGRDRWPARLLEMLAWTPLAALICLPYWRGVAELGQMGLGFAAGWRNNASLYNLVYAASGGDYERGKPVVAALLVVMALAVAWRRPGLVAGTLQTVAGVLFLSANCFPWYLLWMVPLLAAAPQPALLLWTALVPLSYHILIGYQAGGEWREDPAYLWLEYLPVFGMLLAGWVKAMAGASRKRRAGVIP